MRLCSEIDPYPTDGKPFLLSARLHSCVNAARLHSQMIAGARTGARPSQVCSGTNHGPAPLRLCRIVCRLLMQTMWRCGPLRWAPLRPKIAARIRSRFLCTRFSPSGPRPIHRSAARVVVNRAPSPTKPLGPGTVRACVCFISLAGAAPPAALAHPDPEWSHVPTSASDAAAAPAPAPEAKEGAVVQVTRQRPPGSLLPELRW